MMHHSTRLLGLPGYIYPVRKLPARPESLQRVPTAASCATLGMFRLARSIPAEGSSQRMLPRHPIPLWHGCGLSA